MGGGSNKNVRKRNPAKSKAGRAELAELKAAHLALEQKPNKTREDHELLEKLARHIKHVRRIKIEQKSETHSRLGKRH